MQVRTACEERVTLKRPCFNELRSKLERYHGHLPSFFLRNFFHPGQKRYVVVTGLRTEKTGAFDSKNLSTLDRSQRLKLPKCRNLQLEASDQKSQYPYFNCSKSVFKASGKGVAQRLRIGLGD